MTKNELKEVILTITQNNIIDIERIPDIALYMDQLLTFFDDRLSVVKRNADDKILTKTMVNNYTKDKLLKPPLSKKYSKEQMLLLAMIINMKGILTIGDIDNLLKHSHKKTSISTTNIYAEFTKQQKISADSIEQNYSTNEEMIDLTEIIFKLVIDANMKKQLAEKLIDRLLHEK